MNEQDLIQRLQELPKEIEVSSNITDARWDKIAAGINASSISEDISSSEAGVTAKRSFFPSAMAASFLIVAFLSVFISSRPDLQGFDSAQQRTLSSLQQANSQYYAALGLRMKMENAPLQQSMTMTLKDLRQAQKHYRMELAHNPDNTMLYKRLIKTYEKERTLLKQILS